MEGEDDRTVDIEPELTRDAVYLNYHQLQSLPNRLFEADVCATLQCLYAKHNLLKFLPPEIKMLQNLKELYLHSNGLETLPEELGELKHLELLGISENQLTSLPAWISKLQNLKRLQLARNKLTQLPTGLGELRQLQSLEVSHNYLHSVPSQLSGCVNLKQLCLDSNQLVTLPRQLCSLGQLSTISACGNKLMSLPQDLGRIPTLIAVYVDNNPFLTSLPASILQKTTGFYGYLSCGTSTIPEQVLQVHQHISIKNRQETETTILMPPEIRSLGQRCVNCVPSLLELTLRNVFRTFHGSSHASLEGEVPADLSSFLQTPTAHCQGCDCEIFVSGFPVVLCEQGKFCGLGFCCSTACIRQCFLRVNMPFLYPCMEDMALALVPL